MKTRTMNIDPQIVRQDGQAWGNSQPELILEAYEDGEVSHRVRVKLTPVLIEDIAMRLWEVRGKYAKALTDMTARLKGE